MAGRAGLSRVAGRGSRVIHHLAVLAEQVIALSVPLLIADLILALQNRN